MFIFSKEILIGMIRYGLGRSITEKVDYCTKLLKNDLYDEEFSPFCEKIIEKNKNIIEFFIFLFPFYFKLTKLIN